jgi:hypothetical protein
MRSIEMYGVKDEDVSLTCFFSENKTSGVSNSTCNHGESMLVIICCVRISVNAPNPV